MKKRSVEVNSGLLTNHQTVSDSIFSARRPCQDGWVGRIRVSKHGCVVRGTVCIKWIGSETATVVPVWRKVRIRAINTHIQSRNRPSIEKLSVSKLALISMANHHRL